jgi:putative membrane protein
MNEHLWAAWSNEPAIWLSIGLPALAYAGGARAVWRRAGYGHGVRPHQVAFFGLGLVALILALASPLEHLADELLSAHMVQHLLLIMVAAPLLVLGRSAVALAWALPRPARLAGGRWWHRAGALHTLWRWLNLPLTALALHLVTLWVWHVPALYQAALSDETVHALEHLLFLSTGMLFWQALLRLGGRQRLGYGLGVLYLFAAAMGETMLGALMLFSQQPWYPAYAGTAVFGLSALEDQQLAGAIMWVPPGVIMLGIAAGMFLAWLDALERRVQKRETGALHNTTAGKVRTQSGVLTERGMQQAVLGDTSQVRDGTVR